MDFSVTRQLTSKIPERVSTQQIKAGLQRIKKAQQQVLSQLKKTHPDSSVDVRTNSQVLNHRKQQNEHLKTELNVERQRSTQKSTLYRRRVVDLQNSLAVHQQNEYKLKNQNRVLEQQIRNFKVKYSDLEKDYEKLVQESQSSNKNVRNLEKQVMDLVHKLQQEDVTKLRLQFANLNNERNSIMAQKVNLLKINSKLDSENIELKSKIANMVAQQSKKDRSMQSNLASANRTEDITTILNQIDKMNISHQYIFSTLRSNTRLPKTIMEKENEYQNSLNKILEMLHFMQKGANNGLQGVVMNYRFDHEESFRLELQRMQNQFAKRYKKDMVRHQGDRDELQAKIKSKDRKIQEMQNENQQLELKISELRKQKSDLLQQITDLSRQISHVKQSKEKQDSKKIEDELKKQRSKDQQYHAIILQLNQQMEVIQKQKKDLDSLIGKMAQSRSQQQLKNKKRMSQIEEANQNLRMENERLKAKCEGALVQKEHMQLSLQQAQNKNSTLNKEIAREVLQKQKILSQLNKLKQQNQINQAQAHKYRLQSDNIKKQSQNVNNSYLLEIERLIKQGLQLRQQIEVLLQDRNQLREMKGKYGLLMKDNQILGKKARYVNSQLDHLWMIKEVEYQNLNKVLSDLKPL